MDAKLTLSMDSAVITAMKTYASENNSSISHIVENFFKSLISSTHTSPAISPLVQELSGIIPTEKNEKDTYTDYLEKKYE